MKKPGKPLPIKVSKGNVSVLERLHLLNKTQKHAVLATDSDGQPYTSLIAYALTSDMKGIVFATPKDTSKYRNILKNRRVSLLIDTRSNTEKDYMGATSGESINSLIFGCFLMSIVASSDRFLLLFTCRALPRTVTDSAPI